MGKGMSRYKFFWQGCKESNAGVGFLNRLRWFGHVECKNDNDWVKRCIMMWQVEGIRQRGRLKMTWLDCVKNDMESLGLSLKDVQFRNKWRRIKWATANTWKRP